MTPDDKELFERKLSDLGRRLDTASSTNQPAKPSSDETQRGRAMGMGFGIAAQLVAGVAVGGFAGHLLDRWLGTTPWLLAALLIMGFAAGMLNVIRTAREMEKMSVAQSVNAKSVPDDDEAETH